MKKINKFFSLLLCTAICFEMIQIISYAEDSTAYGGIIGETIFYEEFDSYLPYDITSTNSQAGRQPLTLAIEDDEKANDGKSMTCKGNGIFSGTATVTIPFREKIETADSKIEVIARIKPIYLFGTTASTGTSQKYFYERFMQINGTKGGNGSNLYSIYNASWTNSVYLLDWKTRLDKYYSVLWGKENTTADFPENPEYVTYKYTIDGENNECTISYSKDEKNYTDMVKYTPSEMPDMLTSVSIGSTLGMSYAIDYVKVTAYKNNNIYVSPNGDDSNPGKIDSPLATLDGARKKAVKLRKSIGDEPINVYFRGGDYTFNSTVEFSELDSGSENASVTYSAYKGETVNFRKVANELNEPVPNLYNSFVLRDLISDLREMSPPIYSEEEMAEYRLKVNKRIDEAESRLKQMMREGLPDSPPATAAMLAQYKKKNETLQRRLEVQDEEIIQHKEKITKLMEELNSAQTTIKKHKEQLKDAEKELNKVKEQYSAELKDKDAIIAEVRQKAARFDELQAMLMGNK